MSGAELVNRAVSNLTGIDIHPVAITTARANFVLALRTDLAQSQQALTVPVFMADTLAAPQQGFGLMVEIAADGRLDAPAGQPPYADRFQLPTERDAAQTASLAEIVDFMDNLASPSYNERSSQSALESTLARWGVVTWPSVWQENLRLLRALRKANRDTIWSFVLTNAARPHELAQNPVDLVVGNPPWLTVMDIHAGETETASAASPAITGFFSKATRLATAPTWTPQRCSRPSAATISCRTVGASPSSCHVR